MSANCPHDGPSKVLQTRRFQGQIYRERVCDRCGQRYYTVETPAPGNRLPKGVQSGKSNKRMAPTWQALGIAVKRFKRTETH